jgi:hypothetical protein
MWEQNCKTLEILNPRISETIILNPRIQKPEPKLTHSGKKKQKPKKKKEKKKEASREKIYHQPTWNIETLLSAAPVPRKTSRKQKNRWGFSSIAQEPERNPPRARRQKRGENEIIFRLIFPPRRR